MARGRLAAGAEAVLEATLTGALPPRQGAILTTMLATRNFSGTRARDAGGFCYPARRLWDGAAVAGAAPALCSG